MSLCATKKCATVFSSMFRWETRSHGLALTMLVGTPMDWDGVHPLWRYASHARGANVTSGLPGDNFIWDEKHVESEGTTDAP